MVACSINEPFVLEHLGAAYRTFSPSAYGIDFYGDSLCAPEAEVKAHPEWVAAFRAASLKGVAYAIAHKEATIDLILRSYSQKKSREALLFEAEHAEMRVGRDPDRIGEQDPARWRRISATYHNLGFITDETLPRSLIWDEDAGMLRRFERPLLLLPASLVGLAIAAVAWLVYRRRRFLPGSLARLRAPPMFARIGRPRLSPVMSFLFIRLIIPLLIFLLIYNYNKNSAR